MPHDILSTIVLIALYSPPDCQLEDRHRFPPLDPALAAKQFARAHLCHLEHNQPLETWKWESWCEAKRDARWCYDCWDWLQAAQGGEGRGKDYWLYSLRRLRQLIGDEAYFAGRMPPPAPLWRFTRN